jgi:hypothetical protein
MPADVRSVLKIRINMRLRRGIQSNDVDGPIVLVEAHRKGCGQLPKCRGNEQLDANLTWSLEIQISAEPSLGKCMKQKYDRRPVTEEPLRSPTAARLASLTLLHPPPESWARSRASTRGPRRSSTRATCGARARPPSTCRGIACTLCGSWRTAPPALCSWRRTRASASLRCAFRLAARAFSSFALSLSLS